MKNLLLLGAGAACALLLNGCRPDDEVDCPTPTATTVADFARRYAPPIQEFTFDPTQAHTFTTINGSQIQIRANAFVRADGSAPTGSLTLSIQEAFAPADMFLLNFPTQDSYGNVIQSGGEFHFVVREGTRRVYLGFDQSSGQSIIGLLTLTSKVPARLSNADSSRFRMYLFVKDSVSSSQDSASWTSNLQNAGGNPWSIYWPVTPDGQSFINRVWPVSLGWLNCDTYYGDPAPPVTVRLDAGEWDNNFRAYLIPTNRNGAFRPYYYDGLGVQSNIPDGTELTAVVLRVKDGKYYFGTQRAAAREGFVYRPVLEELTEDEVIRRIRLL